MIPIASGKCVHCAFQSRQVPSSKRGFIFCCTPVFFQDLLSHVFAPCLGLSDQVNGVKLPRRTRTMHMLVSTTGLLTLLLDHWR